MDWPDRHSTWYCDSLLLGFYFANHSAWSSFPHWFVVLGTSFWKVFFFVLLFNFSSGSPFSSLFWGLQLHFQPIFRKFPCGLCFCTQCWSSLLLFTVASLLHSLLFPFLWIWPSDDVCVRAYITRTDGGGVWWVLWILVALDCFSPLPAQSLPLFLRLSQPMLFL